MPERPGLKRPGRPLCCLTDLKTLHRKYQKPPRQLWLQNDPNELAMRKARTFHSSSVEGRIVPTTGALDHPTLGGSRSYQRMSVRAPGTRGKAARSAKINAQRTNSGRSSRHDPTVSVSEAWRLPRQRANAYWPASKVEKEAGASADTGSRRRFCAAGLTRYSPPMWAPFSATERFISSTMSSGASVTTANKRKTSK
jgi:hypothetical protein